MSEPKGNMTYWHQKWVEESSAHDECRTENALLTKRIEALEQRLKDTEFLYHAYFVLASEKGAKPGSRELIDAAARFEATLASLGEKEDASD